MSDELSASGTLELIKPEDVLLDPDNPRIKPVLHAKGITHPTQEQIADAIKEANAATTKNRNSFQNFKEVVRKDGRINERPLVRKTADGKIIVVHGNTRILVAKLLKKDGVGGKFDRVECIVLPPTISKEELEKYMRVSHRSPQTEWHPVVHAMEMYELASNEIGGVGEMTSRELQDEFRVSPATLKAKVMGYAELLSYMEETGDKRPIATFSYFEELYRNKAVKELLETDDEFRPVFYDILKNGKLHDATHVKYLPRIKDDDEAWETLTEGKGKTSGIAVEMILGDHKADNNFNRIRKVTQIIEDITESTEAKKIKKDERKRKIVLDLAKSIHTLADKAGIALDDIDEV